MGNYPLVYKEPPFIHLGIVYNPFVLHDVAKHRLVYDQDKTLADYMEGLPEEVAWRVAYNGEVIEPEDWPSIKPQPFSNIVIVRIPEGGSGKSILRMVAMIAVMVAAFYLGPEIGAVVGLAGQLGAVGTAIATAVATATIMTVGAAIVNALLPPQNINPSSGPSSTSYGFDGPKNTAREGVPVPIVYGQFQVGGNVTDCFTRNIGDDQYLFMRTALNDGPVAGISNIQINGQDITTYKDVEYRVNLGNEGEQPVSWFSEAVRLENVGQKIDTTGVVHQTQGPCDRLRVDVSFPLGLITIQKDGNHRGNTATLVIEYQMLSDDGTTVLTDWAPLPLEAEEPLDTSGGSGVYTVAGSNFARFTVMPAAPVSGNTWAVEAQYKLATDTIWTSLGTKTGTYTAGTLYYNGGNFLNPGDYSLSTTISPIQWDVSFPSASNWEVRFIGGSVQDNTVSNPNLNSHTKDNLVGTVNSLTVTRETQTPFRLTYQSSKLTRANYRVRVRRTTAEDTDINKPSQCWLTDVGEIDDENVTYEGTAMLSLKIKMTDQINAQPTLTALVSGTLVNIYDEDGHVTGTAASANPADIVLDMLLAPERGGGDPSKVMWAKFAEWRDFCAANSLEFNGVFDFVTTLWDAMQAVARVGHGTFMPQGTRYTVAIDQAADPVMIFTGSNMYVETFKKTWIGTDDRANEIQQQFFDKDGLYRQKTIRLPNVQAQSQQGLVKPASLSGLGINNVTQATREAEYQARQNSYILNSISFDAPIEALGLNIGDVALIQHDSSNYAEGVGGRLEAGSTTTQINLDRPVSMTVGNQYTLLVNTDALKIADVTIQSVTGTKATVTGLATNPPRIRRLIQGSHDTEVIKVLDLGTGSFVLTLDDPTGIAAGAAAVWDTDVIEERDVLFEAGEFTTITLATPLPGPPKQFANFLFGEKVYVKQPYRLRKISGGDDLYRRTLDFIQYDERVYEPGSWGVPVILGGIPGALGQVRGLHADWDKNPAPQQQRINVRLDWARPEATNGLKPYAGADVYYQENSGNWQNAGTTLGTNFSGDYNRDEVLTFKVVAFDKDGNRANFEGAPTVQVALNVYDIILDPPHNLAYSVAEWDIKATAHLTWDPSTDSPPGYRVDYYPIDLATWSAWQLHINDPDQSAWPAAVLNDDNYKFSVVTPILSADVTGLHVQRYVMRVRAEKGFTASPWAYLGVDIEAPGLPAQVTGLRLNGGAPDVASDVFTGPDASWTWDDILATASAHPTPGVNLVEVFQDYQVEIADMSGTVLRTEYTVSPAYTYSFAKNAADTTGIANTHARRHFQISVQIRTKQGTLSIPTTQEVTNPPPLPATGVTNMPDINGVLISWNHCTEPDYAGTMVVTGTTPTFSFEEGTIQFSGKADSCRIVVTTAGDYYVRVGHYDVFEDIPTNFSGATSLFIPTLAVADLENIDALGGELQSQIDEIAQSTLQLAINAPKRNTVLEQLVNTGLKTATTAITTEQTQRQAADDAFAQVMSLIGAASPNGLAFELNTTTVEVTPGQSMANYNSQQSTRVGSLESDVYQDITTRTTKLSTTNQKISLLGSTNGPNTAFILNDATTYVDATTSLASYKTGVSAILGNSEAYTDSQWTVSGKPGYLQAQQINTLGAQVGGYNARITTLESVTTGSGGLVTKYGVTLDVNGNVTGFQILNGSAAGSSQFVIVADKFALVAPGGGSPITPFSVVNGFANFANPVTVLGSGSAKLIIGPAFGANHDLVLWYGPNSIAVGSATMNNAIMALNINGSTVIPGAGGGIIPTLSTTQVSGSRLPGQGALVTTGTVTAGLSGSSNYTAYWVSPNPAITVTNPNGLTTAFQGSVNNGSELSTTAVCYITDTNTGKVYQISIPVWIVDNSV